MGLRTCEEVMRFPGRAEAMQPSSSRNSPTRVGPGPRHEVEQTRGPAQRKYTCTGHKMQAPWKRLTAHLVLFATESSFRSSANPMTE